MAWSFRFATLNKDKMPPIMVLPQHPHLDIKSWLDLLDLPQYDGKLLSPPWYKRFYTHFRYKNISNSPNQKAFQNLLVSRNWCTSVRLILSNLGFVTRLIVHELYQVWLHYVINMNEVSFKQLKKSWNWFLWSI